MVNRKMTFFDYANVVFLSLISLSMLYPFVYMLAISLSDNVYVLRNEVTIIPKGFTLSSYKAVLSDPQVLRGYANTILYVILGTGIALLLTVLTAYPLSRKGLVFSKTVTLMIVFTMLFSGGMIPTFLVVRSLGLMNTIWAMVLPGALSAWFLFVMRTFFQGIPNELIESGKMDGLNDFGVLWRIVLPLSKPALATIGLFVAVGIWNNFMFALLYLRSEHLYPLQVIIRRLLETGRLSSDVGMDEDTVDQALKFTTILVGTIPILIVYPFLQKYFVKGVLIGSVKG
ncbi:carbohydrate ABC transporter permease [Paenibacillus sp. 1P07SE]|uniref:carbohydrate ABC transporter permease n=1 Tax=Paenibacillus sp. 1P07SE TaxID=3132209 RepID=UPI0039A44222